jgi:hypothetical protein
LQFTYKDLEKLTGVGLNALRQWKQHGHIWDDGESLGAGSSVRTFDAEMIGRIMWLAHMQQVNMTIPNALSLWEQALLPGHDVLIMTGDGFEWVSRDLYNIRLGRLYKRHHTFFSVSVEHFLEAANKRVHEFMNGRPEFDRNIRSPVVHPNSLVH